MVRSWEKAPSYVQILQAFDDNLARHLMRFRQTFGELDEEPLAHLALEQGLIDTRQLQIAQKLWKAYPRTYLGKLMIEEGFMTEDQLERLLLFPHFRISPERAEVFAFRGLRLMEQRLWLRGYLTRADAESLGLIEMMRLPLELKPLADILVLNGDMPAHLQPLICPDPPLSNDPLWRVLDDAGVHSGPMLDYLDHSLPLHQNLAVRLVEEGLMTPVRLSNLVLHVMRADLPQVRIQGVESYPSPALRV